MYDLSKCGSSPVCQKPPCENQSDDFQARLLKVLDTKVFGHDVVKRKLVTALWWNNRRVHHLESGLDGDLIPMKCNVLFAGDTGLGKTYTLKTAAQSCGVPFHAATATSFSSVGYVGLNVEDLIAGLLRVANGNIALAERGIVFLDEVDKLRKRTGIRCVEVGCEAVQQALLAMLEGTTVMVPWNKELIPVNTAGITFVGAGAFVGLPLDPTQPRHIDGARLIAYGLIPEFVGRFSVRVPLFPFTEDELKKLLLECDSSPLRRLQYLFQHHGIDLVADKEWVATMVGRALQMATGVRGLHEVVSDATFELMGSLPDLEARGSKKVALDRRLLKGQGHTSSPTRAVTRRAEPPAETDVLGPHTSEPPTPTPPEVRTRNDGGWEVDGSTGERRGVLRSATHVLDAGREALRRFAEWTRQVRGRAAFVFAVFVTAILLGWTLSTRNTSTGGLSASKEVPAPSTQKREPLIPELYEEVP